MRRRKKRLWTVFVPVSPGKVQEVWHNGATLYWRDTGGTVHYKRHRYVPETDFLQAMGHFNIDEA